ncbi:uncharacterized protein LOC141890045 isoform X3 [Acropora palmata]|uniref:uncharacterized protein LOC141890045 isoform X3 n=1 Tax=Acropora palmata TaxID=6131 RepID=UPI003DA09E89
MKDFFESLLGRLRQIYGSDLCEVLKQTRPGSPNPIVTLTAFRESRLCGVTTLKEYISKTELLRGSESQLIVSHSKPHKAISRDTIIRCWTMEKRRKKYQVAPEEPDDVTIRDVTS